jgi:hypothetical protein
VDKMTRQRYFGVALLTVLLLLSTAEGTEPTSVIVDFDSTTTDLSLGRGESGVLNIVIENTGGQSAEDATVKVYSRASLSISKTFSIGTIIAGESKTLPVVVKALDSPKGGLATVIVNIKYDGYDSGGSLDRDEETNWEIPVWVSEDPLFQVTPSETTYHEGALEELSLSCMALNPAKDLQTNLSSSCITVIGTSKQYIGDISPDEPFTIKYTIKPSSSGACETTLDLTYTDEFGSAASEEIPIGLNVEDAGVDFKVVGVGYDLAGPGSTVKVKVSLKNEGSVVSEDTTLSLSLSDPFVPVDGAEKFVGDIGIGQQVEVEFELYVSWDAETKTYSVPLIIDYKTGGSSYEKEKGIGIDISGEVILEILNVESASGSVRIQVANIGTRNAESVKATLVMSPQASRNTSSQPQRQMPEGFTPQTSGQQLVEYKSSIKTTKEATFTFSTSYSGTATLILEYTGLNNERVTQEERINIGAGSVATASTDFSSMRSGRSRGGNPYDTIIIVVVAIVLAYLGYRYYKRKKKGEIKSKGWKNLYGFI